MEEKDSIELQVRRSIDEQMSSYRDYLQSSFSHLTWGLGIIVAAAVGLFIYFFGQSIKETRELLTEQIDQRILEYRINEDLKQRTSDLVADAVVREMSSESTQTLIANSVETTQNSYIDGVRAEIQDQLAKSVETQVSKIEELNVPELVQEASIPIGAVLPFNRQRCPERWKEFAAGRGRYIVGLQPNGLVSSTVGFALKAEEDRSAGAHTHQYTDIYPGGSGQSVFEKGRTSHARNTSTKLTEYNLDGNDEAVAEGTNAPYIQLLYCEKI